ncbi:MAG: energy transducer TonB [Betaproteobacteria bacterium]|jgi:Periplasmic protein TonB, links inner and outer membranes|nr:energy transducer TonB [Betaproteobacteria bacterium]
MMTKTLGLPRSLGLAALLEGLIALAFLWGLSREVKKELPPPVTQIQLTQAPEAPKTVPPPPVPPQPQPPKPVVRHTVPQPQPRPIPVPTPAPAPVAQAVPQVAATPTPTPPQPAAPAAPALPQHIRPADISVTFADKVRSAVQGAVVFPMAARAAHLSGETKVSFDYKDGSVSGAHVITTSGNTILDKAALAAVHSAHYPVATAEYVGRILTFEIWVRFLGLDEHE